MSPTPTGLLASEVVSLRAAAGISIDEFAKALGVSPNVVERWEALGVPSGPTALAIRFVAQTMEFEFPVPTLSADPPCGICSAPAAEHFHGIPVCPSCHRHPAKSLEQLGFQATTSLNVVSQTASYELRLPTGVTMGFVGRFLSEGLGTTLAKMFTQEPQIGQKSWDDAVYVQFVEPALESITDLGTRELIQALVAFGLLDIDKPAISVTNVPFYGGFDDDVFLLCGLLAARES